MDRLECDRMFVAVVEARSFTSAATFSRPRWRGWVGDSRCPILAVNLSSFTDGAAEFATDLYQLRDGQIASYERRGQAVPV